MTKTYEMVTSVIVNAPVDKVWKAWSDGEQIKKWWGPEGFTSPVAESDFREGGVTLVCMKSPEGFEIYNTWTYTRISPMEVIEFIHHFTDKNRKVLSPTDIGLPPGIPQQVPHRITFKSLGQGKTEIYIVESGYLDAQVAEMSKAGMDSVLRKLASMLEE